MDFGGWGGNGALASVPKFSFDGRKEQEKTQNKEAFVKEKKRKKERNRKE